MKRILFGLGLGAMLAMTPDTAAAQHAGHGSKPAAEAHADNPARHLIATRAELKLTDAQVIKLEAIAHRMDAHHKSMGGHHGGAAKAAHAKVEAKIHEDFFGIFNDEQMIKVKAVMKAHHERAGHSRSH